MYALASRPFPAFVVSAASLRAGPEGLALEYTSRQGLAAAFPRFDLPTTSALSAITWSGEMSGGDVCYGGGTNLCAAMGGSKAASGFGEGSDAPLVLFDAANASEVRVP